MMGLNMAIGLMKALKISVNFTGKPEERHLV
jgi:hypothetical protein